MKRCYQCDREVHELSRRSRCVHCEEVRANANEAENERLREDITRLDLRLTFAKSVAEQNKTRATVKDDADGND